MRNALLPASVMWLLWVVPVFAQGPCQTQFSAASSAAGAAGSLSVITLRLENPDPTRTDCPPVLEPVPPWVRMVALRPGPAASTEFHYRVFENFEKVARTAVLRANGAVHQIQQGAGPHLGRVPRMAVRGGDGWIRMHEYAGTGVQIATGLQAASDPAAYQGLGCHVEVVVRDTQNRLAANAFDGCTNQWAGWRNLGGTVRGRPVLAGQPGGTMLAVARDQNGAYWLRRFPAGQSGGDWVLMGGVFVSDPAMAADAAGHAYVLGRDLWNTLWMGRINAAGQFLGWTFAGGIVQGQPAVAAGSDGIVYAAARDPWGGLSLLKWKDGAWLGWSRGGDGLASDPVIAAPGDGLVYIAALNELGALRYRSYAEGSAAGWGPWILAGGNGRHPAAAAVGGEALFGLVDAASQLQWHRPATGEWRSFGIQVAGAGRPGGVP